jgi:hypothetical protein
VNHPPDTTRTIPRSTKPIVAMGAPICSQIAT